MFRTYSRNFPLGEHNGREQFVTAHTAVPEVSKNFITEKRISGSKYHKNANQDVFGFMYHAGTQKLSVSVPGDVVPVVFNRHSVLSGVNHKETTSEIVVSFSGIYEISYLLNISSVSESRVMFNLQADGENLEGSQISCKISVEESIVGGAILTELKANAALRVIMTSHNAVDAEMSGNGVSASMTIKKIS